MKKKNQKKEKNKEEENWVTTYNLPLREGFKKKTIETLTAVKPTPYPAPPIFDRLRFFFSRAVFFIDRVVEYGMKQILWNFWLILTMETIETQFTSQINFDKYEMRGEI